MAKSADARAAALAAAGLTEEHFNALSAEEQAKILAGASKDQDEIEFVTMVRDPEQYPEPHSAQVHPDEVDNYRPGGWEIE
ncbi:hypothetical protein RSP822_18230 [Ralstonia solanacearum]|nr:hypothetical protein RSP822_18230 [Ralstonia solanacearum]